MQESVEEVLQDTASWAVSNTFSLIDKEFRTDITSQQLWDAAVGGFVASLVTGGFAETRRVMYDNALSKELAKKDVNYQLLNKDDKETKEGKQYRRGLLKLAKAASTIENIRAKTEQAEMDISDAIVNGHGIKSIFKSYQKAIDGIDSNTEQGRKVIAQLTKQLFVGYKAIMDIYGEFGSDRMVAAEKLLSELDNVNTTKSNDELKLQNEYFEKAEKISNTLTSQIDSLLKDRFEFNEKADKIKNAAQKVEADKNVPKKKVKKDKDTDKAKDDFGEEIAAKLDAIWNEQNNDFVGNTVSDEQVKKTAHELASIYELDIVLWDNHTILEKDGTIFAPIEAVRNLSADEIVKNAAERTIVTTMIEKLPEDVLSYFVKEFNKFAKATSDENLNVEVIYNLLYNQDFYNYLLYRADIKSFNVLKTLDNVITTIANESNEKEYLKQCYTVVQRVRKTMGPALALYFCNNESASIDIVTVFTDAQLKYIQEHRSNALISNVLVNEDTNNPNYDNYLNVLYNRINNLNVDADIKLKLRSAFAKTNVDKSNVMFNFIKQDREYALLEINSYYKKVLYNVNNGEVRLVDNDSNSAIFNSFLDKIKMTVKDFKNVNLTDEMVEIVKSEYGKDNIANRRQLLRDLFAEYCNGEISYTIEKGEIKLTQNAKSKIDINKRYR